MMATLFDFPQNVVVAVVVVVVVVVVVILLLALQLTVGFGLSNNTSPFFTIYHQLSPSHSQHLKISFYFFSPSFPGSSSSSRPFQFLSEDFLGILSSCILARWPSQLTLCPFIHFTIFSPLLNSECHLFHNFIFFCSNNTLFINRVLKFKYQPVSLRVTIVSSLLNISFLTTGVKTTAIPPKATTNSSNHFYNPPTLIKTEVHALPVVPSLSWQ